MAAEQRRHDEALPPGEVGHVGVVLVGLAVEHPLVGPEQVERRRGSRRWRPTTAHQRRVTNAPMRIRNSPTKPLSPGSADRAKHHHGEDAGHDRRRLLQAPSSAISRVWRRS